MSEDELPPGLAAFFDAERIAPAVDVDARLALRARLTASVEHTHEPAHSKGRMHIFDKRIVVPGLFIAAALGLLSVTAYRRHVEVLEDEPVPPERLMVELGRSFVPMPDVSPVAPMSGADLAITAGESAWIHVSIGTVDVEVQSTCNAEVEMSVVAVSPFGRVAHSGIPLSTSALPHGGEIVGKESADGKASTYHLLPGPDEVFGMYEYTSRCIGQPLRRGRLVVDRDDGNSIGPATNARVFGMQPPPLTGRSIWIGGAVLPGARVAIGANLLEVKPDPTWDRLPIFSKFMAEIPISFDHTVSVVRVDDVKGTHFYVERWPDLASEVSCAAVIDDPKDSAAELDARGNHAGALKTLETAMASCKPDRDALSLALTYACRAGDADAARKYWRKLPPELQQRLEPECARNQIRRDVLDRSP